jgi:uncharacterized protein (TIGR02444 family)
VTEAEPPRPRDPVRRHANPFWNFSLGVYEAREVAAECLRLQDDFGADVNVLLFCAWLGWQRRIELAPSDIEAIIAAVEDWQANIVRPLRAVRRYAKAVASGDFYRQLTAVELTAERLEQDLLFAVSQRRWAREGEALSAAAMSGNIKCYLAAIGRTDAPVDRLCECLRTVPEAD